MKREIAINVATYGLLAVAVVSSFLLPESLTVSSAMSAEPAPDELKLVGTIRDFRVDHADFGSVPAAGYGHYAGAVSIDLGGDDKPELVKGLTNFTITNGKVIPGEPFAARIAVLGAAITSGGDAVPVTTRARFGSEVHESFGPYADPVAGNVNDSNNPRYHVFPTSTTYPAGTQITTDARSWLDGDVHIEASTQTASPQIKVLRDNDPVPNIAAYASQSTIADFIGAYINTATDTMNLEDNQIIFLYELGTTDLSSSAADFQDLVLLLTLATDPAYFTQDGAADGGSTAVGFKVENDWHDSDGHAIAPHLFGTPTTDACGNAIADTTGTVGVTDNGGIASKESFNEWFRDVSDTNQSMAQMITLTRDALGVYEYYQSDFTPIDDQLLGNESGIHNRHFTLTMKVDFVYDSCSSQFVEFTGGDGAWVFIDRRMAIDLGGVQTGATQRVEMDRMGLVDGQTYQMHLFYAQRDPSGSPFHLRTNVLLSSDSYMPSVSSAFD